MEAIPSLCWLDPWRMLTGSQRLASLLISRESQRQRLQEAAESSPSPLRLILCGWPGLLA